MTEPTDPDEAVAALCAAVAAYDQEAAEALVAAGADPDRVLPDGSTPLLRAVESGSRAMVGALLWSQDLPDPEERLPEAERARLLDAARRWYRAGAEAELRRLTGAAGPAETSMVEEQWCQVEQIALGGLTVRAGHGAVLTVLERVFGIVATPEELVERAVRHPDPFHVDWAESRYLLGERSAEGARETVTALRHHASAGHRLFAADWLWGRQHVDAYPHHEEDLETLAVWADLETDPVVLAAVLMALGAGDGEHPRLEAIALRSAGHPDPRVRVQAVECLGWYDRSFTAAEHEAMRVLVGDPDDAVRFGAVRSLLSAEGGEDVEALRGVVRDLARDPRSPMRQSAADSMAESADRTAEATELLLSLLDADDWLTRMIGAYGLALRDHPGTPRAYARVEELGPLHGPDHRVNALWDWQQRNGAGAAGGGA
ncbi:HEAT repeat domain-containing protein [Streptomyces sp. NBC_01298]|uniref:HEAT repeat domain-containing protein n=1 Tax=Streptomyces sp. NBC_01298 TaxID=2903817 RepID=UPI002E125B90|nr:HEAT repeat domain-containing protein [Streptomyces sp. NBC_01298]